VTRMSATHSLAEKFCSDQLCVGTGGGMRTFCPFAGRSRLR
jgi:hypothetical protein